MQLTIRPLNTNCPLRPTILHIKVPERRIPRFTLVKDHKEMEVLIFHVIPRDIKLDLQLSVAFTSFNVVVDSVRFTSCNLEIFPEREEGVRRDIVAVGQWLPSTHFDT